MKEILFAVWFKGNKVTKVKDVRDRELYLNWEHGITDKEEIVKYTKQFTGASAVVYASNVYKAIDKAAEELGLNKNEVDFSKADFELDFEE